MGKNTSVVLGAAQEAFIRDQIAKGRYATVSEVVRHGVSLLQERETRLEALRRAIDAGDASGDLQEFNLDEFLRREVVPVYDEIMADPSLVLPVEDVFDKVLRRESKLSSQTTTPRISRPALSTVASVNLDVLDGANGAI